MVGAGGGSLVVYYTVLAGWISYSVRCYGIWRPCLVCCTGNSTAFQLFYIVAHAAELQTCTQCDVQHIKYY